MKRAFIIHGWEGRPDSNWFDWLRSELEKKGFSVEIPQMPNADHPQIEEWLAHLEEIIGEPDVDTYLIGHSLGAIAILRYLERLKGKKIGGAVFAAGFPESIGIPEIENFFAAPLNYEKVKFAAKNFVAINSDNDHYVPLRNGEILRDKLGAKLIVVPNGRHLNEGEGNFQFPTMLKEILRISK